MKKITIALFAALIATGCVGKDNFSSSDSTTTGGATTSSTGATTLGTVSGANSCTELGAYTSLDACKSTTQAQCYPSTKIIAGSTSVCYFPVSGWESCPTNPAAWSYGSWGSWCQESTGVYLRSRAATCQRTIAACDCIASSVTQERCSIGNSNYSLCTFGSGSVQACNATPTPVPTATPTATPSWCANAILNWQVDGNNSETVLRNANNSRYTNIISHFAARGYTLNRIRGSTYTLSSVGPLLDADRTKSYVVQIEGSSSRCFIGNRMNLTVRLLKGGVEMTSGNEITGCISFGNEIGRAVDRALGRMGIATCQ